MATGHWLQWTTEQTNRGLATVSQTADENDSNNVLSEVKEAALVLGGEKF